MYLAWLNDYALIYELDILAYCLMTNHIHLVVVPHCLGSIADTLRITRIRHCQRINAGLGWSSPRLA